VVRVVKNSLFGVEVHLKSLLRRSKRVGYFTDSALIR
jgi:hypothetical protein